jgi:secreted protein with Ig-like and vWFA domain
MPEKIQFTWAVNTPYIPVASQPRLLYLLVEIEGGGDGAALPVNLGLVVDTSDSMHIRLVTESQFENLARMGVLQEVLVDGVPAWKSTGIADDVLNSLPSRMARVEDALRAAVDQLRADDRFSLVAFAGHAVTLVPNTPGTQKSRLIQSIDDLSNLSLGDETHIAQGISKGFEEVQREASSGRVNRLLLLTDGFAFDEEMCRQWADQAQQARIPISTMGLGGEFNEELMIPIADQTGGEAYLLEDPEEIPEALAHELQRAQAVRYRNLELKLRISSGVEVRGAFRVRPTIAPANPVNEGGSYNFGLGDLVGGENVAFLLELVVPPRSAGVYRLAQTLLAYDDPAGGLVGEKVRSDVLVEVTPDPSLVTEKVARVMHVIEALSAYKLQQRARADVDAGDVSGATRKLRAAATRLLDMGEEELAAEVEQQAEELEQSGQADPQRTKKLRYETRKLVR